jgi:hypothetical protein
MDLISQSFSKISSYITVVATCAMFETFSNLQRAFFYPMYLREKPKTRPTNISRETLINRIKDALQVTRMSKAIIEDAGFPQGTLLSKILVYDIEQWYLRLKPGMYVFFTFIYLLFFHNRALQLSTSLGKRKQNEDVCKPNMNLYIHNIISHVPNFYDNGLQKL